MDDVKVVQLLRPRRPPQFVSRRTAAALLDLSVSAFDSWVKRGVLPPAAHGSASDASRWCWLEIVAWMLGDRSTAPRDLFGLVPAKAGQRRGPRKGTGGRPRKVKAE